MCTGDGIVKKKGGNVDSRRREKIEKMSPSCCYRMPKLLALSCKESKNTQFSLSPVCTIRDLGDIMVLGLEIVAEWK